jgi:hypothetical protein
MTRHARDSGLQGISATTAPQDGPGERTASLDPRAVAVSGRAATPFTPGRAAPPLDREARRRIGRNLRLLYADVLNQPLPDRFTALLDSLSSPSDSREDS